MRPGAVPFFRLAVPAAAELRWPRFHRRNLGLSPDPRILLALWIYATLQGEGSARELDRPCRAHLAYQSLCGGVSLNHRPIADFRSQSGEKWDALMTDLVAGLMRQNLVTLKRVAQDGMRVRANAGRVRFIVRRRSSVVSGKRASRSNC